MRQVPLLPNEPRVLDWPREQTLTERHLLPHLAALELFCLALRASLDGPLSQAQPAKLGKPYPLGQCLEISQAVEQCLTQLAQMTVNGPAAQGHAALLGFMRAGGTVRQVWGDLRGEYFQNAFMVGTLYVDVSNDTVFSHKPKVEILPFSEARFAPVEDFWHFIKVARNYWQAEVYPNIILPSLAPYFPLLVATPGASIRLEAASNYMFALARRDGFRASAAVLDGLLMGDELFQLLSRCLAGSTLDKAVDAVQGKAAALHLCNQYRSHEPAMTTEHCTDLINRMGQANQLLQSLTLSTA
jgi:hypothetical protein